MAGQKRGYNGSNDSQKKKLKNDSSLGRGFSGILFTCDALREREAVKDAVNILSKWAEQLYPQPADIVREDPEDNSKDSSAQSCLEKEIKELQQEKKKKSNGRFQRLETGVKGVLLFRIGTEDCPETNIDPVVLVKSILTDVRKTKEPISRYLVRMIPFEKMFYPSVEDLTSVAGPIVTQYFKSKSPCTFAIEIKKRFCDHIRTLDIIKQCASFVDEKKHKVNLKNPDVTIVIEAFRGTCGICIVDDFVLLKKYNLRQLLAEDAPTETKD